MLASPPAHSAAHCSHVLNVHLGPPVTPPPAHTQINWREPTTSLLTHTLLHRHCMQTEHVDGFLEHLEQWQDRVNNLLPGEEALRPGQVAAQAGVKAHHPIVIIPGDTLMATHVIH